MPAAAPAAKWIAHAWRAGVGYFGCYLLQSVSPRWRIRQYNVCAARRPRYVYVNGMSVCAGHYPRCRQVDIDIGSSAVASGILTLSLEWSQL
ncbi:unnamed protein product [Urochloa humidicola]